MTLRDFIENVLSKNQKVRILVSIDGNTYRFNNDITVKDLESNTDYEMLMDMQIYHVDGDEDTELISIYLR